MAIIITLLVVFPYSYHSLGKSNDLYGFPGSNTFSLDYGSEVYMTLLCPPTPHPTENGGIDYYFEATRILAYRLLHRSDTKDLQGRRLIVLTTESVLPFQIRALQDTGAIVRPVAAIAPPKGTDPTRINPQWKDQYTKLALWNMTEFSRILYIDADILPIRPMSPVFDTPLSIDKDGEEYIFGATYDSAWLRDFGRYSRPVPTPGPNDTHAGGAFNAGMFFIKPSRKQAAYVQSIYETPVEGQDFTNGMEQDMLHYAYRDEGEYPWTRLSQMYNTQWPRLEDWEVSHALHDKMWREDSPVQWDLRRYWYVAWGEMLGWMDERRRSNE